MFNLTLKGTPKEMGIMQGSAIAAIDFPLPPVQQKQKALVQACMAALQQHTPAIAQELQAFVAASGKNADEITALSIAAPFEQTMPACSLVAVLPERSASGRMMIGRNYDWTYDAKPRLTHYKTYPEKGYAHMGNCDIWLGRSDGLNEHGLFVGMSASFISGVKPGITFWYVVRHLLETCRNTTEALAVIASLPHAQNRNYLLADESGQAVVVETTVDGIAVRQPQDGIVAATNHPVHPSLAGKAAFVPQDSHSRYERMMALTKIKGSISLDDLRTAMNDRPSGLHAHGVVFGQPYGTLWSWLGELDGRRLGMAEDEPKDDFVYEMMTF